MIDYAGEHYGNATQILADEESRSIKQRQIAFWASDRPLSAKLNVPDLQASEDNLPRLSCLGFPAYIYPYVFCSKLCEHPPPSSFSYQRQIE